MESNHPLVKDLVNHLRDISIDAKRFRELASQIAQLLVYEALQNAELTTRTIDTWIGKREFGFLDQEHFIFVAILRAGLPMQEGAMALFPRSQAGFLAMKRDEKTFEPILYYERVPDLRGKRVFICDPMVATGGSLSDAVSQIKTHTPAAITTLNIIAAPEGVEHVRKNHTDITLHIAQIDEGLDERKFIIPGLGDAGDRAFNTL